jgi:hypothetical protein
MHVFYNDRSVPMEILFGKIHSRWLNNQTDLIGKEPTIQEVTTPLMEKSTTNIRVPKRFTAIAGESKKIPIKEDDLCRPEILIETSIKNTQETIRQKFNKFYPLGRKLLLTVSSKKISTKNGIMLLELLNDWIEENDLETIMSFLSPRSAIITQKSKGHKAIIEDLLESRVLKNNNPKGAKKKPSKKRKGNMNYT